MEKYLEKIDNVIKNGKYKDTWESLQQYHVPEWYEKTKFGIFIHWGVYSVPAFGSEWYSRNMYIQGSKEYEHHIKTYGAHKDFGYKDFIPMFKAEKFDAHEWITLFKNAGAQYVMPVAEHHDGFQMYDSELSDWNAKKMGPKRDVLGEITAECEKAGLVNGASSHRVEHWFFMGHGKEFESDIKEPLKRGDFYWPSMKEPQHHDLFSEPTPSEEYLNDWLCRCCEIVDKYRPKIVYFDWWIQHSAVKPYLKKFAAYYYNRAEEWGEGVVINYKHDAFGFGTAVVDIERGQYAEAKPYIWQTDTAVAKNSWGYTENNKYKTAVQIVRDLVDIVSKNGRVLLNIGPRADGTIPDEDRNILLSIGKWLKVNGEAIYGAKLWRKSAEGPTEIQEGQFADDEEKAFTSEDIRFTVNGGYIYAACLNMKDKDSVCIKSLSEADASRKPAFHGIIKSVEVLGYDKMPEWSRDEKGLTVKTVKIDSDMPVVFKISVD
ncbi:MAG: alpha-L-fucosidase [Oscillospiraceae bacterium]|nr:alpha-L-fucosidase [Oscillospiraceae bacterium]